MILTIGVVSLVICLITTGLWWYYRQKAKKENFIATLTVLSGCAILLLPVIAVLTGVCTLIAFYWQAKGH